MALASTDPHAKRVPAATPQARPTRTARLRGTRGACSPWITETGALIGALIAVCRAPTQAIRAVAEGPEPDFLRRRAVIVRHQLSPQGSGTGEEYRVTGTRPDPSLLQRNADTGYPAARPKRRSHRCLGRSIWPRGPEYGGRCTEDDQRGRPRTGRAGNQRRPCPDSTASVSDLHHSCLRYGINKRCITRLEFCARQWQPIHQCSARAINSLDTETNLRRLGGDFFKF